MTWYVAKFGRGLEVAAARELDEGGDRRAFVPLERWFRTGRGFSIEATRAVMSGYCFVEGLDAERWHAVADLDGFLAFVGPTERPGPLLGAGLALIEGLLASAPVDWVIEWPTDGLPTDPFDRGDLVRFRRTPAALDRLGSAAFALAEQTPEVVGIVEWTRRGALATVSFRGLFGREMRIEVSAAALERVEVESKTDRRTLYNAMGVSIRPTLVPTPLAALG